MEALVVVLLAILVILVGFILVMWARAEWRLAYLTRKPIPTAAIDVDSIEMPADTRAGTAAIRMAYAAFLQQGFTDDQALKLTRTMMNNVTKGSA